MDSNWKKKIIIKKNDGLRDEKLIKLVEMIRNELGIQLFLICEKNVNHSNKIQLQFQSCGFKKFMDIIMDYENLSEKETEIYDLCLKKNRVFEIDYSIRDYHNMYRTQEGEISKIRSNCSTTTNVEITCNIYFPNEYLDKILAKLIRYIKITKVIEKIEK